MDNYAGANANGKLPGFRGGRGSWTNLAVIASSHIRVGLGFGVRGVNEAEEQCMEDLGFDSEMAGKDIADLGIDNI